MLLKHIFGVSVMYCANPWKCTKLFLTKKHGKLKVGLEHNFKQIP